MTYQEFEVLGITQGKDAQLQALLAVMRANPESGFTVGFAGWLANNMPLFCRCAFEAAQIAKRVDHYSMRTIIEYVRHQTHISDSSIDFKVNNNSAPDMARLCMAAFPELDGLFAVRATPARERQYG